MRTLILMRGAPGSGKSTFIKEHGLEQFALSADNIRLLIQAPEQNVSGEWVISQQNDKKVWETLFDILEKRMERGEFTVIDATNSKTSEMTRYKDLASEYRYRIFVVDFTDLPIEECKRRNAQREGYKVVPDYVIDKMYSRFAGQKIPSSMTVIKPENFDSDVEFPIIDLSEYEKIHFIGDIHGCNTVLQEYFKEGIKDTDYYIFTGDFIDRGIENAQVLEFMLQIYKKPNVCLLQGNHERYIWEYANDLTTHSRQFNDFTKYELQKANLNKGELRQLFRKIRQCGYYKYDDKKILVSHAGIATMPENLLHIATEQLVKGVGTYKDMEEVAQTWLNTTEDNFYQVFGHRNTTTAPMKVNNRVYCLEGQVEFGGHLRVLTLDHNGFEEHNLLNTVFKQDEEPLITDNDRKALDIESLMQNMKQSKYIKQRQFGDISSFNFTRDAFYKGEWNEETLRARGLFINTNTKEIVARSYDKFFNVNEMHNTKIDIIKRKFAYPIKVYKKENGFLGIIGYDSATDELVITTKSSLEGEYVEYFKEILAEKKVDLKIVKEHCKTYGISLVFEVVHITKDPHIIEYYKNGLFLLEAVYNKIEFEHLSYDYLQNLAMAIGVSCKIHSFTFENQREFIEWYNDVTDEENLVDDVEGYVIEDSNGFMVKVKLPYYKKWKKLRGVLDSVKRKGYIDRTSMLVDALENDFYNWCRDNRDNLPDNILTARTMFEIDRVRLEKGY